MAPPSYSDLGKNVRDLHSKGFHPGSFKFDVKTKTSGGVKLATNGQRDTESGKVLGGVEAAFAWPDYGVKYTEKWNTDNQLVVDVSIEDKLVKGLKNTFVSSFNPTSNKKKGTVKTAYKHEYFSANVDVDMDYAGPHVAASLVAGYKGWLAGYQMDMTASPKSKLNASNFTLGYDGGNHVCNAAIKNTDTVDASYYHRLNSEIEAGVAVVYNSKGASASMAGKYNVSPDTAMKVKASCNGELGLSLQQRVTKRVTMTLSSVLDAKNMSAGGHRVGMSLEYE